MYHVILAWVQKAVLFELPFSHEGKKKKAKISLLEQISLFELIWHTCLEWGRAHDIHPDNCVAAYNRVDKIQNIPKKANFFHQLYFLSPDIQTLFSHLCMHFAQLTIHAYNHGLFKTIHNYTCHFWVWPWNPNLWKSS